MLLLVAAVSLLAVSAPATAKASGFITSCSSIDVKNGEVTAKCLDASNNLASAGDNLAFCLSNVDGVMAVGRPVFFIMWWCLSGEAGADPYTLRYLVSRRVSPWVQALPALPWKSR